ncbi:MAG TPA: reverse transcriptase family protein [Paludibacter sp.]
MKNTFETYKEKFVQKASENGYSGENISKCLKYAEPLIKNNFPVIFNTSHFCALVGYNKAYIKKAALYPRSYYRHFQIPKKDGTFRTISEPLPSLKEIQNWILVEILYKNKVSKYAKAYVVSRGLKDHVKYHVNADKVLTLDIKKFFDSIKFEYVEKVFKKMGYSSNLSNLFAKLCYLQNGLPQGAPTSPFITNILLYDFDESISDYCRKNNVKFTRYADDLAFSGALKKIELISLVKNELRKIDLKINNSKTKLMRQNEKQIISGLIVNSKVQVPKSERNKLRNEIYYIKKFSLDNHLEKINQSKKNYLLHLIGKISYVLSMNPTDNEFIEYKKYLYELKNASK